MSRKAIVATGLDALASMHPGVDERVIFHLFHCLSPTRSIRVPGNSVRPNHVAQAFTEVCPCHLRIHSTVPGRSPCELHSASITHAVMS